MTPTELTRISALAWFTIIGALMLAAWYWWKARRARNTGMTHG